MAILTIFTPAYNRASTLPRTYESLSRQSCKDFEWLIVDDGSSDNTRELVESWQKEADFKIRYIYQGNQGMHGAHNTAYKNIHTELNTCIDSDDWMPENAVELIVNFWKENGSDKYAGMIGLDQLANGKIIGCGFPENMKETTLLGYYAQGGKGDKKLVYRTEVINKYPEYPIFEGEKYVGLNYKYMLIDQDYPLLTLNAPLVTVEYQEEGSSSNMYLQYWKNPKGFVFLRKTEMKIAPTFKRRFITTIHYVANAKIAKEKNIIKECPKPLLCLCAYIPGILWYNIIKRKVKAGTKFKVAK